MTDEHQTEKELFIHADAKIEKVRTEVSEVIQSILNQGQKLDQLAERINEGVSKTAYKTYEKVNEISVSLTDMKHDNEKRDIKIGELRDNVKSQGKNWDMFIRSVIYTVATTLLITVVIMAWKSKGF